MVEASPRTGLTWLEVGRTSPDATLASAGVRASLAFCTSSYQRTFLLEENFLDLRGEVDPDEDDRYSSNFCWSNSYSTSSSTRIEIHGYDATISAARSVAPTVVARLFVGKIIFVEVIVF